MTVIWLPGAAEEVEAIAANRSAWSTAQRGSALARRIVARGEQIGDFPRSGRVIPELQVENLREVLQEGYRILYEVFPDRVEIFGVVSSRQEILGR